MARIAESEIERLKREVDLAQLVREAGIELKLHGANLVGRCPFHDDRTPSLVITPAKNLWHCMGACQTGGSAIDWVMRSRGVSFRHAVEHLRGAPEPVQVASDQDAFRQVVRYYHQTLKESPEALRYLESRGLAHTEMIDRFQLGFANRTLGYRLPEKNRKAGAEIRGRLQALGVLRESGHEHFNGSIVIPLFSGPNVAGMYGRKITPNLREGTPLHLYLPGPHRGVFNENAVRASKEVILCESLIDALTFWCAGFRNVTASYGINGFTEEIRAALDGKHVYIAYDNDDAGNTAAERLKEELPNSTRVIFPKGMDANEYGLTGSLAVLLNKTEKPPEARGQTPDASVQGDEITFEYEDRRYRVRGLAKNLSHELLKINLLVASASGAFHVDTFDLYAARQRAAFTKQAAEELQVAEETLKRELGRVLLKLEELQNARSRRRSRPRSPRSS